MTKLKGLRTLHLRSTPRACGRRPRADEGYPELVRMTASLPDKLWATARVPCWAAATAVVWWRWAGHVARLGALRVAVLTAIPRAAWWRRTMEALHKFSAEPDRQKLNCGQSLGEGAMGRCDAERT